MYIGHGRLCVCASVCLSIVTFPHYCTDSDVGWVNGRGCRLVVHYWADLQSMHGFRCYDNTNAKCQRVLVLALCLVVICTKKVKVKAFSYSIMSVGPGPDPGVQTVSPQVTVSHPPGGRLPLLSARPVVTYSAAEHHRPLAGTKLYCSVTETHRLNNLPKVVTQRCPE